MSEPYQPKLNWQPMWPDLVCEHTGGPVQMYCANVAGRQAAAIRKEIAGQRAGIWEWSGCYAYHFNRVKCDLRDRGVEPTARLAVQRAEEYFFALMASPLRPPVPVSVDNEWDPDNSIEKESPRP